MFNLKNKFYMNDYNEKWTKEKFLEYRRLKRSGYTHQMLKEYFGEDIYYSGLYNKNGSSIPKFYNFINEIKINQEETYYDYLPKISNFIKNKTDYILTFNSNNISYIICFMFFPINNIDTYNIVFTTEEQWIEYNRKLRALQKIRRLNNDDFELLDDIISKETNLNDLFPIFRKLSWIILDFYNNHLKGKLISIGETKNEKKINFYRNIIKDTFKNISEKEVIFNDEKYFIYNIE